MDQDSPVRVQRPGRRPRPMPIRLLTPLPSLLLLLGRAGTVGAEFGGWGALRRHRRGVASFNRTISFSGRIREGEGGCEPRRTGLCDLLEALSTTSPVRKKETGRSWAGGRTPNDGRRALISVLFMRGMLVSAVHSRGAPGILSTRSQINWERGAQTVCIWPGLSAPHARTRVY